MRVLSRVKEGNLENNDEEGILVQIDSSGKNKSMSKIESEKINHNQPIFIMEPEKFKILV